MERSVEKIYHTDVLVIGGGGAGVASAISAARTGANVIIASKGKVGNSGNTIMIGGSFAMDGHSAYYEYGLKEADPTLTKEVLFESIVKDGFHLSDQNIVEQFVDESPAIVNEVRLWGEKAGQKFIFGKPATWTMSGNAMGRALQQGIKETSGIELLEDVFIIELLSENQKVTGAIGIDIFTGETILINAKAVVMATGGFQPFSLKNTNSDMTGDGVAMAFRAGAELSDMEFLLYLVTCLEPNEIKGSILPVYFVFNPDFKYKITDVDGNEIEIPEKLKEIEEKSELGKLIDLYYFGKVILSGKGTKDGGVYFDFSDYTDQEIDDMFETLIKDMLSLMYKDGYYHGDNVREYKELCKKHRRMQIGLGNEYSVGGIVVNEKMETSIEGLYAGGECTSGAFGANRVADAVVEMLVQGYRAGISAAEYSKSTTLQDNNGNYQSTLDKIDKLFANENGLSAVEVNQRIESISDEGLSFIRNEEGLTKAIKAYEELEKSLEGITLKSKSNKYNYELVQALQAENRLLCSKLAAIMAKERKESRGLHLRSDFTDVDNDEFLIRFIAKKVDKGIHLSKRKPIVTKMPLPDSGKTDYIQYILENDMGLENIQY